MQDSTLYFLIGRPIGVSIPLTDEFTFNVVSAYTQKACSAQGQICEYKLRSGSIDEYEMISHSNTFRCQVTASVAQAAVAEVTDPRLDLVYAQMHESYEKMLASSVQMEEDADKIAKALVNIQSTARILTQDTATWDAHPETKSDKGCIYVYTDYVIDEEGVSHAGFKIGDDFGTPVVDLPFASAYYEGEVVTATEKEFWNNKERTEVVGEELIFTKS